MPYHYLVTMMPKHKVEVLLVISNATISPQLVEIIKQLAKSGHNYEIYVVASADNPLVKSIDLIGVSYRMLPEVSKSGLYKHLIRMFWFLIKSRPSSVLVSGQYATYFTLPVAFCLRVPRRIYIRHHSNFHHKFGLVLGLMLDKLMNFFSTRIVAVSQVVKDILVSYENVRDEKVEIIYNGVDLELFLNIWRQKEKNSTDGIFRIGVISRLTEWKGVEDTAKAFREFNLKYPNSSLHVIGAPADSAKRVFDILKELRLEKFNFQSQNLNIPLFLSHMDVFVHVPTEISDEAFGIVYIEALASGIPCVFTKSGILNELENAEKFCSIVEHRDSRAIANSLEDIYLGKVSFEKIPASWLSNFDLSKQGSCYLKVLTH